tara:strand:- start:3097 stop:4590 length:1494 start_codon:yes stop_codon:yes gene_type:complete
MASPSFHSYLSSPFKRDFWLFFWNELKHLASQATNLNVAILTGPRNYFFGLLPTVSTFIMLLIATSALSVVPWAIASMSATTGLGASVGIAQGASAYLYSFIGVMAFAIGGYWFEGPLSRGIYRGTPVSPGATYGHEQNVDVHKLYRHAHHLVLAGEYFHNLPVEEKHGLLERDQTIVVDKKKLGTYYPFSLTINKGENKKHLINGAGRDETAGHLNFSSGCFSSELNLTFNERTALTMMAIVKIRQRKTLRTAIFAMYQNVLDTIELLQNISGLFKVFLPITNFVRLLGRAAERAAYKECLIEVTKAGMGEALRTGLKKAACFSLSKKERTGADVREVYAGGHWYDFIKKPLHEYLRKIEGAEHKQHWFLALVDNIVMNMSYFISRLEATELNSEEIGNIIAETMEKEGLRKLHFSLTGKVKKLSDSGVMSYDDVAYPEVEKSIQKYFRDSLSQKAQTKIEDYFKPAPAIIARNENEVVDGNASGDRSPSARIRAK